MSEETDEADRNHRRERRRKADRDQDERAQQMEQELRAFANNGITRRIVKWAWPLIVAGLLAGWAKWKGIPDPEWQKRIEAHQKEEEAQREQVRREVALLKAEVQWNASLSIEQRKELAIKIDRLEAKLDRWFEKTGR